MLFIGVKEDGKFKVFRANNLEDAKTKSKRLQCILIGKLKDGITEETQIFLDYEHIERK
jgi:hypothetical protein